MSIEGIALEHFSTTTHTETETTPQARTCHAVFRLFLSDSRKQDSATTTSRSKCIIELLKQLSIIFNMFSTIWGNIYGCAEHHRCDTVLNLISMFSRAFYYYLPCYYCTMVW